MSEISRNTGEDDGGMKINDTSRQICPWKMASRSNIR